MTTKHLPSGEKATMSYRKANDLTHQEKMQIYNETNSDQFYKTEIARKFNITVYTLQKVYEETHELIRYKIYGEAPKHPKVCNVCGGKVKLNKCDKFKSRSGFVYYCTECHSWVGTSPRHPDEALGELGTKEIRLKRRELHQWFDKLWRNNAEREIYYDKLAKALGKDDCHFSQMSMEELNKSLELVKKWWFQKYDI